MGTPAQPSAKGRPDHVLTAVRLLEGMEHRNKQRHRELLAAIDRLTEALLAVAQPEIAQESGRSAHGRCSATENKAA